MVQWLDSTFPPLRAWVWSLVGELGSHKPSGTAVTLAEDIIARLGTKTQWVNEPTDEPEAIAITSKRIGMTPGDHTVTYTSEDDVLEIRHSIKNRRTLAQGAVVAAEFLCGKQGIYTMDDLF